MLPLATAIAVVPATFNTINKWVAGISDTFALGILNEAIGLRGVTVLPNEVIRHGAEAGHSFNWRPAVSAFDDIQSPSKA